MERKPHGRRSRAPAGDEGLGIAVRHPANARRARPGVRARGRRRGRPSRGGPDPWSLDAALRVGPGDSRFGARAERRRLHHRGRAAARLHHARPRRRGRGALRNGNGSASQAARLRVPPHHRPAAPGRDDRAGECRPRRDHAAPAARVSGDQCHAPRDGDSRVAAGTGDDPAAAAAVVAGRGGAGAGGRLRERREPAARRGGPPRARVRGPRRDWRLA